MTPFIHTNLPANCTVLDGETYYSIYQIANHMGVCVRTLHNRANAGELSYILAPGLRSKKKLVHQTELIRFLEAENLRSLPVVKPLVMTVGV